MELRGLNPLLSPERRKALLALVDDFILAGGGEPPFSARDREMLIDLTSHALDEVMDKLLGLVERSERMFDDKALDLVMLTLIAKVLSYELESITRLVADVSPASLLTW